MSGLIVLCSRSLVQCYDQKHVSSPGCRGAEGRVNMYAIRRKRKRSETASGMAKICFHGRDRLASVANGTDKKSSPPEVVVHWWILLERRSASSFICSSVDSSGS